MAFKELAAQLLRSRHQVSGGLLARVIGKLGSIRVGCTRVVVLTRGLMWCLDQLLREWQKGVGCSGEVEVLEWMDTSGEVELSPLAVAELRFWLAAIQRLNRMRMKRAVQVVAFVDGCPQGYGSILAEVSCTQRLGQFRATQ
jgi:hypothetical protein